MSSKHSIPHSHQNHDLGDVTYRRQYSKWLPRTLELFGGRKEAIVDEVSSKTSSTHGGGEVNGTVDR